MASVPEINKYSGKHSHKPMTSDDAKANEWEGRNAKVKLYVYKHISKIIVYLRNYCSTVSWIL